MTLFRRAALALLLVLPVLGAAGAAQAAAVRLVVVGSPLIAGDAALRALLEGMGHAVTVRSASSSSPADTAGHDLVMISSSVGIPEVNTKFRDVAKPVFIMKHALFDEMGLVASALGQTGGLAGGYARIADPAHVLAAGLSGNVQVFSPDDNLNWGLPGAGALRIAHLPGDSGRSVLFAYEAGAPMAGMAAPARRVAFFFRDNGAARATGSGAALFRAAVAWALGQDGPPPSPAALTREPAADTVLEGAAATFTADAAGEPAPAFQWFRNGADIPGANSSAYTFTAAASHDGAVFTVVARNASGADTSAGAVLTVHHAPRVTVPAGQVTVDAGQAATFSVEATGNPPPAYQWRRGGVPIPGATEPSYTTPAATPADDTSTYRVYLTNSAGTALSVGTLFVRYAPVITHQPLSVTARIGQTVGFAGAAMGNPRPAYQWRRDGVDIPGATEPTVPHWRPVAVEDHGTIYTMVATNSLGTATSQGAVITVNRPPSIAAEPADTVVSQGGAATFTVQAAGSPTLSYQWLRDGTAIPGATSAAYVKEGATAADDASTYRVIVTNAHGSDTSRSAVLRVLHAPVMRTESQNYNVLRGATLVLEVEATGYPEPVYHWNWTNHPGPGPDSSGRRIVANTDLQQIGSQSTYTVWAENSLGSTGAIYFQVSLMAVHDVPVSPSSASRQVGQGVTFTAEPGPYFPGATAQWRRDGADIPGATGLAYTLPSVALGDAGTYTAYVSHERFRSVSRPAVLTVLQAPQFTLQPDSAVVLQPGQTATFRVAATGGPVPTLQWTRNGAAIPGATAETYTTPPLTAQDDGAAYAAVAANSQGSATSAAARVRIRFAPVFTRDPASATVNAMTPHTFTAEASAIPPPAYQWHRNGAPIPGATGATYTLMPATLEDDGHTFSVTATNGLGSAVSASAALTVLPPLLPPAIAAQPADFIGYPGDIIRFRVAATGNPAPTYQWAWSGGELIGATADSLVFAEPATLEDDGTTVTVLVRNTQGGVYSRQALIRVLPRPSRQKVSLTGELFGADGMPIGLHDAVDVDVELRLFTQAAGGQAVYTETFLAARNRAARVYRGLFTLRLGDGDADGSLHEAASAHGDLYAEFRVREAGRPFETLSPRTPVTAPLFAGLPRILRGEGPPAANEPPGTWYENLSDGAHWVRMAARWIRVAE